MRFRVKFDTSEQKRALKLAKDDLDREINSLLNILGTALLSEVQQAYVEKSKGRRGSDGIQWAPLERGTIESRVGARGKGARIIKQRADVAAEIRNVQSSRPPTRGASYRALDKAARDKNRKESKKVSQRIEKLRARRADQRKKFESLVDQMASNHLIGVDTGLQRSSAQPGFRAPDGEGGNILRIQGNQITVGYGRSYSPEFDEKRTLIPRTLPKEWREELERLTEKWANNIIRKHFP